MTYEYIRCIVFHNIKGLQIIPLGKPTTEEEKTEKFSESFQTTLAPPAIFLATNYSCNPVRLIHELYVLKIDLRFEEELNFMPVQ